MIYSLFFIRIFVIMVIAFCIFIIYTFSLMRKNNVIMNKKENIIEAYNKFTALFEEDKYYSESEFHHWSQEYHEFKDDIYSYRGLIDRINRYAKSFKVPGAIVDSYVNLFLAPKDYAPAIDYLFNVYENGIQVIHTRNEVWIEKELEHNQRFFANLDGNKLTLNQRKAILIDEANNLVVSGADRGLTIVGKVGYIIRSKLAAPQEILVLAYNDQARERLQERLKRICEVQINVQTFHGYGSEVLEKVCGAKPMLSELASGDFLRRTLQSFLDERIKELKYTNLLNKYFFYYLDPVENNLEISTQSEYDEYLGTIQIRTLKGETVESLAELELANFLYVNGVNYEYKKKYEAGSPSETGPYTPDFCLPDSNIWIEHIDIDRDGNPAPGVDRTEYLDSWQRKRKTHQENSTELLETYGYQHTEGTLIENLVSQLEVRGVKINKIPGEQVFESLRTLGDASQFIGLLEKFLRLFRSSTYTISDLRREASGHLYAKRYLAFLDLFEPIHQDYMVLLAETGRLDLDDVANKAAEVIRSGAYKSPFKYILVDDFQDISQSQYRLLKSLTDQNWRTRTFCVGDDWQSISRFSGSDLSIMLNYRKYFDPCAITFLNDALSSNEKITQFSSSFIMKNPA